MSLFKLGTGHYLCRGWRGGGEEKKKGGLNFLIKKFSGGQQFDCEVYFKRGPLVKIGNAKMYNLMLIVLLFVYLKDHYFVQLTHLHLTEILFKL